jgi:hypothetical protein
MTVTGTTTTETPSSPPPVRPRRGAATAAAGVLILAAVTLTPWLLTAGSQTETGPVVPTSAAPSPQQAAPVLGQASAGSNARNVAGVMSQDIPDTSNPQLGFGRGLGSLLR